MPVSSDPKACYYYAFNTQNILFWCIFFISHHWGLHFPDYVLLCLLLWSMRFTVQVYHWWWVRNAFCISAVLNRTITGDNRHLPPITSGFNVTPSFCGEERQQQGSPVWNWCTHQRHWRTSALSQLLSLGRGQVSWGQNCFHISFSDWLGRSFSCNGIF